MADCSNYLYDYSICITFHCFCFSISYQRICYLIIIMSKCVNSPAKMFVQILIK